MKTTRNFSVVLTAIIAIAAFGIVGWAAPKPKCSLVGTWSGSADNSEWAYSHLNWTSVVTADSSGTSGGILLSWVPRSGDLSGLFGWRAGIPLGQSWVSGRLNPGDGVWKVVDGVYNYTWYAYYVAYDPSGKYADQVVYSIRVFGTVDFPVDCNHETMTYTLQGFLGMVSPQEMATPNYPVDYETIGASNNESAYETKVPLVVSTTP